MVFKKNTVFKCDFILMILLTLCLPTDLLSVNLEPISRSSQPNETQKQIASLLVEEDALNAQGYVATTASPDIFDAIMRQQHFEKQPVQETSSEKQPVQKTSSEKQPVQETSSEKQPVQETSSEKQPVQETSSEKQPVQETSSEKQPVQETSSEKQPVQETSSEKQPVQETSSEKQPDQETSSEKQPVQETSSEKQLVQETSSEKQPVQETSSEKDKAENENPKKKGIKIADSQECMAEVKNFCSEEIVSNNFLVLDCLEKDDQTYGKLSSGCQNYLWQFKMLVARDSRFEQPFNEACSVELEQITDCKEVNKDEGEVIPCLIEHIEKLNSKPCIDFLNRMKAIIFSKMQFMKFFLKPCKADIEKNKCGEMQNIWGPLNQGMGLDCLKEHHAELSPNCRDSLLRVMDLQSDYFQFDRPLYYACKDDGEQFCNHTVAGNGAVFKCLYRNLGNELLSDKCRKKLELRQQLIASDVKLDRTFYSACKQDIDENACTKPNQRANEKDFSKFTVLLCLDKAQIEGKKLQGECHKEMFVMRSEMMDDYKINPAVVRTCKDEIENFCKFLPLGGRTIDCLMRHAVKFRRGEIRVGYQCMAEIAKLLHLTNPGEDLQLYKPIQRSCHILIIGPCSGTPSGSGNMMTCLLENQDHEDITDECTEHLLAFQFFAVRDFRLDVHLFQRCHKDAIELCYFEGISWAADMGHPHQGPLIFTCLQQHYRLTDTEIGRKPDQQCSSEIRRVMKERARRISLMPEIEAECFTDLSNLCRSDQELMEDDEMTCLQESLDLLSEHCKTAVSIFTVDMGKDISLDRVLMKDCSPAIKKFCSNDTMPVDYLDCLIEYKNNVGMDHKCAASIEHHQLISLKDFRFNDKFHQACQDVVAEYCSNKQTKYEVVACLSDIVRDDFLKDDQPRIHFRCQKQLKVEFLQQGESILLDPVLRKACQMDIEAFCKNKREQAGETAECLKAHHRQLWYNCHRVLFYREKQEAVMGDYGLHHACKRMIKEYCPISKDEAGLFNCLRTHKEEDNFDTQCRQIVMRSSVEKADDVRLNPHLQKACRVDIPKFCIHFFGETKPDEGMDGKVINCLKKEFAKNPLRLTKDCRHQVKGKVRDSALNIFENPVVLQVCNSEIIKLCLHETTNIIIKGFDSGLSNPIFYHSKSDDGAVVECLRRNYLKIQDWSCKTEVANMILESRLDIDVDPLLQLSCQEDLKDLCISLNQDEGRQMACLLSFLEEDPMFLTRKCRDMLNQRRDQWEYTSQFEPTYEDLFAASPSNSNANAIIFISIGILIFGAIIAGLFVGRKLMKIKQQRRTSEYMPIE